MTIALINASNPKDLHLEADVYVDYRDGGYEKCFNEKIRTKEARSWHSLPAVMGTEFFVFNKPKWEGVYKYNNIILLVNRDLHLVEPLLRKLKLMKKKVLIGFHENFSDFLLSSQNPNWLIQFKNLVNQSDGYLNVNIKKNYFFEELFDVPSHPILHAFPFREWKHGLTIPHVQREGILIGTRTLNQRLRRNTLEALVSANIIAKKENTFATYINEDGFDAQPFIDDLSLKNIRVIKGPLFYERWVELISKHRLVYHCDTVDTLGQIIGDACLVDVLCFGGTTDMNILQSTDHHMIEEQIIDYRYYYEIKGIEQLSKVKEKCSSTAIRSMLERIFE